MELRHVRYFLTLAEELSFTRAARKLHISQPPLSAQIKNLEEELGVTLFDRDRRNVSLTPAGERFLLEARTIVQQFERAARVTREAGRGFAGTLTLATMPSLDLWLLPCLLRRLRDEVPGVEVCFQNLPHRARLDALQQGTADLGFVRLPMEQQEKMKLQTERLYAEPFILAISEEHALAKSKSVNLSRLKGEPLLIWRRDVAPVSYDEVLGACRDAGFSPHLAYEVDSLLTVLGLAANGLGIAFVPGSARSLERSGLVYRSIRGNPIVLELGLAYRRDSGSTILPHAIRLAHEVAKSNSDRHRL